MCGIAGILHFDRGRPCSEDRLVEMRDTMVHRGPDDQGVYIDGPLGLAHRRLSIIDLGSGHQPMQTADGALCIVFNGEIYNYRELRLELEARGHSFRTHSDTEVLLHLYREYGEQCPRRLNGIFAFAIWDRARRRLFLARDHMGIKPLYYFCDRNVLIFASEAKALFRSGYLHARCDTASVPEYFAFRHVAGERTLFEGVKVLLPAHSMTVADDRVETRPYWSALAGARPAPASMPEALEELAELATSAVRLQLMSDVPLGTFCSGGVDSSLVTALCAQQSRGAINTYSVGFEEAAFDETAYARLVSQRYGTVHHELRVGNREFAELLPEMIWHNDEPLNFANSVHIFALSRLAKERVTVVLTGEGADELFAGYPRYHIPVLAARLHRLPGPVRQGIAAVLARIGDRRLRKLAGFLRQPLSEVVLLNSATIEPQQLARLWASLPRFDYRQSLLDRLNETPSWLRRVALLDQHTYLVSILNRQDKMSMAASIESRVPLLDYRLVEFANSLPDRAKRAGTQTKLLLKQFAERHLPREVVYRPKSGFGVPLAAWLRAPNGLGKLAREVLTGNDLGGFGAHLNVKAALSEHFEGKADHSEFLWSALNFALWTKRFGMSS